MNSEVIVDITISADKYLSWYSGQVKSVSVTARDGRRIRFPANILQKFVGHDGIDGSFVIVFDSQSKFLEINRL